MASELTALRVLYVLNSSEIGGGNRSLLTLWSGLGRHAVVPHAAAPRPGPMADASREAGVACSVVDPQQPEWSHPVASWRGYRRWLSLLTLVRPAVVHANDLHGARSIGLAAARLAVPLVCHVHFPPSAQYIAWAFRYVPKPNLFILNSEAVHREVNAQLRQACPRAEQRVIYNAVDVTRFRPDPGLPRRRPRVGIVANLLPIKGHHDFLTMVGVLRSRRVDAEYWVVGDDIHRTGYAAVLQQRVQELGLVDAVHFMGFRHDVSETIRQLDVMVSCSHEEPFGLSLIEAMSCGRPVVATRVGGIPEVVEDRATGLLVAPHAPNELADAVEQLLAKPELRAQMGVAGRRRVERLFTIESMVDQTVAIYRQLARGRR